MLSKGECETISDAARKMGVDPTRVYAWSTNDPDFQNMVKAARQVVADDIEKHLRHHKNFIPLMFLLKAYRPEFKESFKLDIVDSKMSEILEELRKAGKPETEKPNADEGTTTTDI